DHQCLAGRRSGDGCGVRSLGGADRPRAG
ncbi:MAG: hypothetical protein AVDCRST_MAG65-62, partial [uncultured Solirubrobacteraceae bacterium]